MRWWSRRCARALVGLALSGACAEPPERVGAVTRVLPLGGDAAAPLGGDAAAPLDGDAAAPLGGDAAAPLDGDAAAPLGGVQSTDGAVSNVASCCVASDTPSCADAQVSACLCQLDPFCCNQQHDALCVREAVSSCGLTCTPPPPVSDCCSPSSTPGCSNAPVLACVCNIDPACCQLRFDQSCVNLAAASCGATCTSEGAF